ncbi:hypothetical protein GCM10010266_65930 [Streptomyces griseomycini]|uniref:hypothetical protein n=1 Tax=Streptomyces griseomycini TaxID=66895 RepID=UPI00187416C2|nr:hypothetical protein [Streptomyces griseomycini]GGQ33452.1 hypothetical protein GCM10010266_65930 [Streptomyces griseomycini]
MAADALEHDLTRAARKRGTSWQQVADASGPTSRASAESWFVRLEHDAASYRGGHCPGQQRVERARDRG